MDETQKIEIGTRIRDLRERSPFKQQAVADKLGIGLRAYQKLEEVGTTRYERCEELAAIFEVDPMWIWEGRERGPSPDPFAAESHTDLDGIRDELSELRLALADALDLLADLAASEVGADAQRVEGESHGPGESSRPSAARRRAKTLRRTAARD